MIISVVIPDELAELIKSLEYGGTNHDGYTEIKQHNLTRQDIDTLKDYGVLMEVIIAFDNNTVLYITALGSLFKDRI